MTLEAVEPVVRDALALLVRLRAEHMPSEAAWDEVVRLRERHPGRSIQLIWERESYVDQLHYDLLVEVGAGTLSISYCADDDVPWPSRGLQRVSDALVLRVNDDAVQIGQVVTSLDYAWHQLHIGRHLIDMSLVDQAIVEHELEVSDDQLDAALTAFRRRRQLFSAAALERWMAEHGASQAQLEHHLRLDVARAQLRQQVTGGAHAEDAYFAAHRADFDRVRVARIFVADRAQAEALHRELCAAPQQVLAVAQRRFIEGAAVTDVFATLRRDELEAGQSACLFDTEPGQLAPIVASGEGFEIVQVLRRLPATHDDETRAAISHRLFERWLADQRGKARVEWFWGAAEAAEVPPISL